MLFCSNSSHFSKIQLVYDGSTDGPTDGPTDGHTLIYRCENASKKRAVRERKRIDVEGGDGDKKE